MADRNLAPSAWAAPGKATLTISLSFSGAWGSQPFVLDRIVNQYSVMSMQPISLANGDNTITVPANATGVLIVPPNGNNLTLALKSTGTIGNTKQGYYLICWEPGSAPANFVLNAGGAITGCMFFWF